MSGALSTLEEVIAAEAFPGVDLALRRGRHIDRDEGDLYAFLVSAQDVLEAFYRRFGCELVHKTDGYFYLLPTSDRLGRRHLSSVEMLVGQALTLLYLDPATVEQGGIVTREQVLAQLAGAMGAESLLRAMNPKRKRHDERVAQETARAKVNEALRRLASLGFVAGLDEARVRLRPALMRFADPVRGSGGAEAALQRLVAEGELVLTDADGDAAQDEDGLDETQDEGDDPETPR
jgi:chromosome partition protein MukE